MKKVIDLTNRYIIIATPLLLFLFFLSVYFMVVLHNERFMNILFGLSLTFLMFSAFVAGWGNMIKSAVYEKSYNEPYLIMKDFAPGVGEYFLPIAGMICIVILINAFFLYCSYCMGMHFIGDPGVQQDALTKAMASAESLKAFLASLSTEQLAKLNMWNVLILSVMSVSYYIMMFYCPAVLFNSKNPIKALFISLKYLFGRKFLANVGLYFIIFGVNFIISILSAILAKNVILSFIMTLVNFYFICCVVIGIFYYYQKHFLTSHLGNSVDTYV